MALAEQVVTRGLNVRQTEALAAATPARPNAARTVSDPETKALEKDLGERLGLGVAIRRSGKGGKLVLSWRDLDQLESVLRLLKPGTAPHPGDA